MINLREKKLFPDKTTINYLASIKQITFSFVNKVVTMCFSHERDNFETTKYSVVFYVMNHDLSLYKVLQKFSSR